MPYVLKIKNGDNRGQYVGRKGFRSWSWKPQEDINNARVFASIAGIKAFHGRVTTPSIRDEIQRRSSEMIKKVFGTRMTYRDINTSYDWKKIKKFRREHRKIELELCIPFTDRYEAIEVNLNK